MSDRLFFPLALLAVTALVALALAMMAVDGVSSIALPHLALAASISGGAATVLGLLAHDGQALPAASPSA